MKHWLIMIGCAVLVVSGASAQQKKAVPPPPKPKDEGPSLEVTMKFIQDKVDGVGPVNYVEYVHDNTAGNDWTNKLRGQVSNIVAVASACRIAYHWKEERNGTVASDVQGGFSLKSVGDVVIVSAEQYQKEIDTAGGHPEYSYRIDPPVFWLRVRRTDIKGSNDLPFFDEQMANRVAKAMVHAVELCGGGAKPEPF